MAFTVCGVCTCVYVRRWVGVYSHLCMPVESPEIDIRYTPLFPYALNLSFERDLLASDPLGSPWLPPPLVLGL